jgi:hypothetical protein
MRTPLAAVFAAACLAVNAPAATIAYTVSDLGGGTFQYTYSISGVTFSAGETLDIAFNGMSMPGLGGPYDALMAAQAGDSSCSAPGSCTAGTEWSLILFGPNSPPGSSGDYLATAQVSNPSLAGPFFANFTLQPGAQPGPQSFTIFDANFNAITSGETTALVSGVPEPATVWLTIAAMVVAGIFSGRLKRFKKI